MTALRTAQLSHRFCFVHAPTSVELIITSLLTPHIRRERERERETEREREREIITETFPYKVTPNLRLIVKTGLIGGWYGYELEKMVQ